MQLTDVVLLGDSVFGDSPINVVPGLPVTLTFTSNEPATFVLDWGDGVGLSAVIELMAVLNIFLGVFNLLPLLPLDGGHILWSIAEKLRGRRVSVAAMWRFSSVGLILLAFLVINGISNDIGRLAG